MSNTPKKRSLSEDLNAPPAPRVGGACKIRIIWEELDSEDRESLERAVDRVREDRGQGRSKAYSTIWLTKLLKSHGFDVSVSTVQRHVNKECACERSIG